jgi:hypothetical protein
MTTDSLKQTGKSLGKTRKTAEYTSSRFTKHFPLVEIIKDLFTGYNPFIMEVKVYGPKQQTVLTLYFYEALCYCTINQENE